MLKTYAIYTGVGRENATLKNFKAAAKRYKDIVSAAITPWPGYIQVEVRAGDKAEVKNAKFTLPQSTKVVIELVPGVVKIVGNGNEAIPLD